MYNCAIDASLRLFVSFKRSRGWLGGEGFALLAEFFSNKLSENSILFLVGAALLGELLSGKVLLKETHRQQSFSSSDKRVYELTHIIKSAIIPEKSREYMS